MSSSLRKEECAIKNIVKMLSCTLVLFVIISSGISVSALSWDGDNANTGGFGFDATSKGYAIRFTGDNCIGYRFSVVDIDGNTRNGAVIDIFRNTQYGNRQYIYGYKFTTKYNKKQLINHQYDSFSTSKNSYNCYYEYNMGFASVLPAPSGMSVWQNDGRNLNPVLLALGINNISDLNYGDKVLVEPIYDIRLEGIYHAVTVSELAVYGQAKFGASYNGGTSYTSDTWGFIAAYTNKHYPNELFTPDGQGLWESASVLSKKAAFGVVLNRGYGVGIAYTEVEQKPSDYLRIEAISPNAAYKEETEVITSFRVYNESDRIISPDSNVSVVLNIYSGSELLETQISTVVIPEYENNLIWFKWRVPKGLNSSDLTVSGTVYDAYVEIQTDSMIVQTIPYAYSQTPDTKYETNKPDRFNNKTPPQEILGEASWFVWEYTDGEFYYMEYGISILQYDLYVQPDEDCPSAIFSNGVWTVKSGYGINVRVSYWVTTPSYCWEPAYSAYTDVQQVYVMLPEFDYSQSVGEYRTLEISESDWTFERNKYADDSDRLHFTPIWYPDGQYVISIVATDVWTPVGMIQSVCNGNTVIIKDSAYDDWYVGEG